MSDHASATSAPTRRAPATRPKSSANDPPRPCATAVQRLLLGSTDREARGEHLDSDGKLERAARGRRTLRLGRSDLRPAVHEIPHRCGRPRPDQTVDHEQDGERRPHRRGPAAFGVC